MLPYTLQHRELGSLAYRHGQAQKPDQTGAALLVGHSSDCGGLLVEPPNSDLDVAVRTCGVPREKSGSDPDPET